MLRASLCVLLALSALCGWLAWYAFTPGPDTTEKTAVVFIPRGASVEEITGLLADGGLIHGDIRFGLLARIMRVSAQLPAGEFRLATARRPLDLIDELVHAQPLQHRITIPEGLTVGQIADIFAADGWVDRNRFIERASDPSLIGELGLDGIASLEGYLFPDTYQLIKPSPGEEALIRKLAGRALAVWNELQTGEQQLDRHQVFTLASIVEKETGRAEERPLIASVFLNRLQRKMKLQSDPTVIYGIENFTGPLTKRDLNTATPYNTYQIDGLPPGPICSPGRDALVAVLEPAESDYLYFVSKNDGSHQFSKSLREHNRAVRTYQR
ncbi:MAG: endolytic transglycosylase MltG [Desulfofustis sp.]|nr:endolytic transglycosylase MltG [Desulfofustis sp.]